MSEQVAEFVVIGAGIAGLATAAALQRRGRSVQVVEERTDTSSGAGISIWPNALAALDVIGLGDEVRAAGGRITAGAMRWRSGRWLRRPAPERIVRALGEPLVVVQRAALRDILAGALEPGSITAGRAVTGVVDDGNAVRVACSDGSQMRAAAVIGADGVGSLLARQLNGPLRSRYVGYTAWRGVAESMLDPQLAGETLGPGVEVGHVPMGPDRTYWFATERTAPGRREPGGELAHLRTLLAGWAEPIPELLEHTAETDVLRNDLYDRQRARRWAAGRTVLVGDAAHAMRPHLGQGGCQGIEDAAILAHLVAREADLVTAFAVYERFRQPRVNALVRTSRLIGEAVNLRPAALSGLLGHASAVVPESVLIRQMAAVAAGSAFQLP